MLLFRSLQYSSQQVSEGEFLASYPYPALLIYDPKPAEDNMDTERVSGTSAYSRKEAAEWLSKTEGSDWLSKTYEDVQMQAAKTDLPEEVVWVRKAAVAANPFANLVTLGRLRTNDVVISSSVVSKVHAAILVNPPDRHGKVSYGICDQNSKNGTLVNTVELEAGERRPLEDLSWINLGSQRLRFVSPETLYASLLDPSILL